MMSKIGAPPGSNIWARLRVCIFIAELRTVIYLAVIRYGWLTKIVKWSDGNRTVGRFALHHQLEARIAFRAAFENGSVLAPASLFRPLGVDPQHAGQSNQIRFFSFKIEPAKNTVYPGFFHAQSAIRKLLQDSGII